MGREISRPLVLAESLGRWNSMLADMATWRDLTELHFIKLNELADNLLRDRLIDPLEHFDMRELAEAAYAAVTEEQIVLYRYFRKSGFYQVGKDGNRFGVLHGPRFFSGSDQFRGPSNYDARIEHTDSGLQLIAMRGGDLLGRIDGKVLIASDGAAYELFETARLIASKDVQSIDDPDAYRLILDQMLLAAEQGHTARHEALKTRVSVSIFMPCPVCQDSFSLRDSCQDCAGRGFTEETPERFRWRS